MIVLTKQVVLPSMKNLLNLIKDDFLIVPIRHMYLKYNYHVDRTNCLPKNFNYELIRKFFACNNL